MKEKRLCEESLFFLAKITKSMLRIIPILDRGGNAMPQPHIDAKTVSVKLDADTRTRVENLAEARHHSGCASPKGGWLLPTACCIDCFVVIDHGFHAEAIQRGDIVGRTLT
jgi:hypothetical protein